MNPKTEDDTFRRLTRCTIQEAVEAVSHWHPNPYRMGPALEAIGWSLDELIEYYRTIIEEAAENDRG